MLWKLKKLIIQTLWKETLTQMYKCIELFKKWNDINKIFIFISIRLKENNDLFKAFNIKNFNKLFVLFNKTIFLVFFHDFNFNCAKFRLCGMKL